MKSPANWRAVITVLLTIYFARHALFDPGQLTLLAPFNLLIHEAGHPLFGLLGIQYIGIAGGSLMQILIPSVFVGYFWLRDQKWESSIVFFWLAASIFEVARYAADAQLMQLELLGGDNVIHDWNYLLSHAGVLQHTKIVAGSIWTLGFFALVCAAVIGIMYSKTKVAEGGPYRNDHRGI